MARKQDQQLCPCGKAGYAACCGRYLSGEAIASTAEELMRSRYTAFSLRDESYLRATWHPQTLPDEPVAGETGIKWIGLDILRHTHRAGTDDATVEFVARFKSGGRAHRLHEVSNFVRQPDDTGAPRWFYVDGIFPEDR